MADEGQWGYDKRVNTVFQQLFRLHMIAQDMYLGHGKEFNTFRKSSILASWPTFSPQKRPCSIVLHDPPVLFSDVIKNDVVG